MPQLLHRRGPIPLYTQVKEHLRARISGDEASDASRLPSERELAKELGVSRVTVRQALRELIEEGAVFTAPGRGTFAVSARLAPATGRLTSFTQEMIDRGIAPSSRVLAADELVDAHLAEILQVHEDTPLVRIRRLRLGDDEPVAVETSVLPAELCPGIATLDLETRSLYETLRTIYRLRLHASELVVESRQAEWGTAGLLHIAPDSPVLFIERRTLLADGRIAEFVRSWYRPDRYQFRMRLAL